MSLYMSFYIDSWDEVQQAQGKVYQSDQFRRRMLEQVIQELVFELCFDWITSSKEDQNVGFSSFSSWERKV